MRVIAKKALVQFYTEHGDAKTALEDWFERTEDAEWKMFAHIKKTFHSVDSVGNNRYVFNIKGNRFRLVALVLFKNKMVYVRFVGTHQEYERIQDIKNI